MNLIYFFLFITSSFCNLPWPNVEEAYQNLEHSLIILGSTLHRNFDTTLPQEWLSNHREIIEFISGQFDIMVQELHSATNTYPDDRLVIGRVRNNNDQDLIRTSIYEFGDLDISFNDDGLLTILDQNNVLYSSDSDDLQGSDTRMTPEEREQQIQEALDHNLEDCMMKDVDEEQSDEESEEDIANRCVSCLSGKNVGHLLKCCGKPYHRACLERWWRTLRNDLPLSCPHCRSRVFRNIE